MVNVFACNWMNEWSVDRTNVNVLHGFRPTRVQNGAVLSWPRGYYKRVCVREKTRGGEKTNKRRHERKRRQEIEKASALKLFSALTDWMDGKGHQHHCNQQQAAYNNNPANQQHYIWSRQLLDILLLQSVVRFSKIELRQSDSFQRLLKM